MSTTLAPRRALADLVPSSLAVDAALVAGGAALTGALAQVSIPLGFTPVPLTGQTLGVLIVGSALGARRALLSMVLYVAAGLAGLPWFAGHAHGLPAATFGYLLGFVVAAPILGALAERGRDRVVRSAFAAMVAGEVAIFVLGVTWLKFDLHVSVATAIRLGFTPFIGVELMKSGLAGLALPGAWRVAAMGSRRDER
jgi:biotin transport system substrate-specific component